MHVPGRSGTTLHTPPHVEQYKHTGLPCMDKTRPISYWYWTKYKVMEGASGRGGGGGGGGEGFRTHRRLSTFAAKERQLVQVVVSPYTYPTFVLSVAVVLLVVSC